MLTLSKRMKVIARVPLEPISDSATKACEHDKGEDPTGDGEQDRHHPAGRLSGSPEQRLTHDVDEHVEEIEHQIVSEFLRQLSGIVEDWCYKEGELDDGRDQLLHIAKSGAEHAEEQAQPDSRRYVECKARYHQNKIP